MRCRIVLGMRLRRRLFCIIGCVGVMSVLVRRRVISVIPMLILIIRRRITLIRVRLLIRLIMLTRCLGVRR